MRRRVESGGHSVPEDVIRRRYERGRRNLVELYLALCDTWIGYDNSSEVPQLIAEGGINQELIIYDRETEIALEVFDSPEILNRLCQVSGGHVRNWLVLLYSCLQKDDPPISRQCLEDVIRRERDALVRGVTDDEWELLLQVTQQQVVRGEEEYQTLLRSMFVFKYQDEDGGWFSINPILAEAKRLQL